MKYIQLKPIFKSSGLTLLFALCCVSTAQGQQTPRQQILHDLGLQSELTDKSVEIDIPETTSQEIEPLFKPVVQKPITKKSVTKNPKIKKLKTLRAKTTKANIAPFYLSAKDYLGLRGNELSLQSILYYEVQRSTNSKSITGAVQNIKLILGADFVAIDVDTIRTIYDFKLNRILVIKPEYGLDGKTTGRQTFDNTSLYAKTYRNVMTVRRATNNGRLKKLPIRSMGKGMTLDAFWIESAMSWAIIPEPVVPGAVVSRTASVSDNKLNIENEDSKLSVEREGEIVFSAAFSDEKFITNNKLSHKNSFLAFAHHKWPLHPSVLHALYAYDAPPNNFEMLSYGPTAPKGQKQVWTLVKRTDKDAKFPLPPCSNRGCAKRTSYAICVFDQRGRLWPCAGWCATS